MKRGLGVRGQIWVETVVYTLIAFALIGLVLAFVKPKVEEIQDKSTIEQSISILEDLDSIIKNLGGSGNQRVVQVGISKGSLIFDGVNDKIFFEIESKYEYSQSGTEITIGEVIVNNEKRGKLNEVNLTLDYSLEYNIQYQNAEQIRKIGGAATPYKVVISNGGQDVASGETIINIDVID